MEPSSENRILHADGDSFFASCEIALNPNLEGRPVWVGGGRRGDGIVIAANRIAKQYGVKTGMACFEAQKLCPTGVLAKPQYDEYRRLSHEMFRVFEKYTPTLVPASIDEGFLDFTSMRQHVWRDKSSIAYIKELVAEVREKVGIPVSAGLGNSAQMAKLATNQVKPGVMEVPAGQEKDFVADLMVEELNGVGKRRQRSLNSLGLRRFSDVAKAPSHLLKKKFGIWGQQLWLFSNGRWNEPLMFEMKDRTTISSATTLPYDEPDYEAALTFLLSEVTRLVGQLRREQLQSREFSLGIRFNDFTSFNLSHRFKSPEFRNSIISQAVEELFHEMMSHAGRPVRQIRIAFFNLSRLDIHPTLWGTNPAEKWSALDAAVEEINDQFKKPSLMTGSQLALRQLDETHKNPKAKCPFAPSREIAQKLWGSDGNPEANRDTLGKKIEKLSRHHRHKH